VLVGWPGVASAQRTVTDATLDGGRDTWSPPGGVIPASVSTSGTAAWAGTQYRFGGAAGTRECVSTSTGGATRSFNVTAPGLDRGVGTYDARFWVRGTSGCVTTESNQFVLEDALRLVGPGTNPGLPPRCGINVMLVLDESGSITASQANDVRDAARAFLGALSGTGSAVSIIEFNDRARRPVGYTTVTDDTIREVFNPYLGPTPGRPADQVFDPRNPVVNATNWQDAFLEVSRANDSAQEPNADLVLFMTDGDPTAYINDAGNAVTGLTFGHVEALRRAALAADVVKDEGSHVLALGVGEAVTQPNSVRRLTAISGPDRWGGENFERADYTLVEDFDDLARRFRQIVTALCRGSITITKLVDEADGNGFLPATFQWFFTADVTTDPGSFDWVLPPPPGGPPEPRRQGTDPVDSTVTFQWSPDNAQATSKVRVFEELHDGYEFDGYDCDEIGPGGPRRSIGPSSELVFVRELGPNEFLTCRVRNRRPAPVVGVGSATIRIIKDAVPDSRQVFNFSGTPPLGEFELSDNSVPEPPTEETFTVEAPGTFVVTEAQPPARWTLTAITCSDGFRGPGPAVSISVEPGEEVSCKFTNVRRDQPPQPPPELPLPPPPPPPPPPPGAQPPPSTPRPSTRLSIVKTATRVARVGDRVRFRLTVTNRGSVAARRVRVRDIPPGAVTLASLRSTTRRRVAGRQGAIWRLGRLAPGASRTIRGSVVIRAGTPGLKGNFAYATAANAGLVDDRANTRLLRQRRAPPVTG
jgi:uncharacterized repeat protein (TIGR01451 family)